MFAASPGYDWSVMEAELEPLEEIETLEPSV
jgi:hypothetical protein